MRRKMLKITGVRWPVDGRYKKVIDISGSTASFWHNDSRMGSLLLFVTVSNIIEHY